MNEYISLLSALISTPSISRCEEGTASILSDFLTAQGCTVERIFNNVVVKSANWDESKPILLLNSHHDTVKPVAAYTRDPFSPTIEGDRLYGLGSNDAGASVVALIASFMHFYTLDLPFNILLVISAEEEVSGTNGIAAVLQKYTDISMAIVGEPTSLQVAVGERGLVVLDCETKGVSGHAAQAGGVNAIYRAMDEIEKLRSLKLSRTSKLLGPVKFSVTQINAGSQHNVIPDSCKFVVDIRTTDAYTNEQIVNIVSELLNADVKARSTRLRASAIDADHPLVKASQSLGLNTYVSPTMSDMALMDFPAIKIGPGDSARSHTADEFVLISDIDRAVTIYKSLITNLINNGK